MTVQLSRTSASSLLTDVLAPPTCPHPDEAELRLGVTGRRRFTNLRAPPVVVSAGLPGLELTLAPLRASPVRFL